MGFQACVFRHVWPHFYIHFSYIRVKNMHFFTVLIDLNFHKFIFLKTIFRMFGGVDIYYSFCEHSKLG